jgi:hypothetical protein
MPKRMYSALDYPSSSLIDEPFLANLWLTLVQKGKL